MLSLLVSLATAQYSLNYPTTGGGTVPPVNQALVQRFPANVLQISDASSTISSIIRYCNSPTDWALTFDDGPSVHTPTLLQELKRRGIKATFFVVGVQVRTYPTILQQIYNDGHEIGIHTWSHPYLTQLSNEEIITEVMYTYQIIKDLVGVGPRYVRAPYGNTSRRVEVLIKSMGFELIGWNIDTHDASDGGSFKSTVDRVLGQRLGYVISLEHDLYENTVNYAPYLMDEIAKTSTYQLKKVGDCIGLAAYDTIIQPTNMIPSTTTTAQPITETIKTTQVTSETSVSNTMKAIPTSTSSASSANSFFFELLSLFFVL